MGLVYLGDLHIRVSDLKRVVAEAESRTIKPAAIIQVGDFGFLWPKYTDHMDEYLHARARTGDWTIPIITSGGNHDNWNLLLRMEQESDGDLLELVPDSGVFYARRGSIIEVGGVLHGFMGGAMSTNRGQLVENIDWWKDEEPTQKDLRDFYDKVLDQRPDTIVTHEAPRSVEFNRRGRNSNKTVRMLDDMFWNWQSDGYKPKRWLYGHHHVLRKDKISGTRFYCCGLHGEGWIREIDKNGSFFYKL